MHLHKSQYFFWFNLAWLSGIGQLPYYVVVTIAIILGLHFKSWLTMIILLFIMVLGWWLGWQRYTIYLPDTSTIPYGQTVTFTGLVTVPPHNDGAKQKLYVSQTIFPGDIYIKTFSYPMYQYGDNLNIECRLAQPQAFEDFAYDRYLARYGVLSLCQNAQLQLIQSGQGNPVYQQLYVLRDNLVLRVRALWPEPAAGLIAGILLGLQDDLFDDISVAFRTTGTVHILVVSGMHVVIIANVLASITQRWCSRRQVFIITGLGLAAFAIITGLAASVIRAALMGLLPLLASVLGRKRVTHYGLALVASSIVAYNPYILLHDVGFQLSFLATIGIIYFQDWTQRWCRYIPNWFSLRETLSTTFAAMITTTPLLVQIFGTFSLVAPLANIVVVPVSNLILFGGVGVLLLAIISGPLANYFAFALWQIIQWLLQYVYYLSAWPHASLQNIILPHYIFKLSYLSLSLMIIWSVRKKSFIV